MKLSSIVLILWILAGGIWATSAAAQQDVAKQAVFYVA